MENNVDTSLEPGQLEVPKYSMVSHNGELCINFVCLKLGVPVSALIESCEVFAKPPKLEVSFSKKIIQTYNEEHIDYFQEQIFNCCLDTFQKQLKELED